MIGAEAGRRGENRWRARLGATANIELPGGLRVHAARSFAQRSRGLAGLPELPADRALHLPRCRAVHTFGMAFALDLIWLDAAGSVVRVDRDVPPRRHRMCLRARSVLECRAGAADSLLSAGRPVAILDRVDQLARLHPAAPRLTPRRRHHS